MQKWRLKLTSAKVEVEVEAELGNNDKGYFQSFFYTQTQWTNSSFQAGLRSTSARRKRKFVEGSFMGDFEKLKVFIFEGI